MRGTAAPTSVKMPGVLATKCVEMRGAATRKCLEMRGTAACVTMRVARTPRKPRLECAGREWEARRKCGSSAAQTRGAAVPRIGGSHIYTGTLRIKNNTKSHNSWYLQNGMNESWSDLKTSFAFEASNSETYGCLAKAYNDDWQLLCFKNRIDLSHATHGILMLSLVSCYNCFWLSERIIR